MARGRCAGCGKTGSGCSVKTHTAQCPDFAALYATEPERALNPEDEYTRWASDDRRTENADRAAAAVAVVEKRRAQQARRFTRRDILEEDQDDDRS